MKRLFFLSFSIFFTVLIFYISYLILSIEENGQSFKNVLVFGILNGIIINIIFMMIYFISGYILPPFLYLFIGKKVKCSNGTFYIFYFNYVVFIFKTSYFYMKLIGEVSYYRDSDSLEDLKIHINNEIQKQKREKDINKDIKNIYKEWDGGLDQFGEREIQIESILKKNILEQILIYFKLKKR